MRKLAAVGALALVPVLLLAQEGGGGSEGAMELWEWLNFALLAAGLVWIFRKSAIPYFAARALSIRKGMIEAEDARLEAQRKLADVEARLARLEADVQTLKEEAAREAQAAQGRARQEVETALAKIRSNSGREIESAGKSARLELKRYSAELALGLAGQKIRARMNQATQDALFRGFLRELDGGSKPASA